MPLLQNVRSPRALERLARGLVYVLLFLTPLFFLPFTLDPLELNKQTLLVLLTLSASLAWLGSMHAARAITFRRGLLNAAPLLLLLAFGASAAWSGSPYLSWLGSVSQQYTSTLSILCYVAVFYLAANLFGDEEHHGRLYATLLGSSLLTGILGLLSLFNIGLLSSGQGAANTVGTINSLAVLLSAMTVLGNAWWVSGRPHSPLHRGRWATVNRVLTFLVSILTLAILIFLDYWVLWVIFIAGLLSLFVFVLVRAADVPDVGRLSMPFFLAAFSLLFLFWFPSPVRLNVPVEVSPSFGGSWSIAWQSMKDHPVLGSGPGTFTFDYGRFHPTDINKTSFWNVRFDRAASWLLLVPATVGVLGLLGWLAFVVLLLAFGASRIVRARGEDWMPAFVAFTAWFTLFVGTCLYSSNITLMLALFFLSGLLASQLLKEGTPKQFGQSPRMGLLLSFAFILISVGAVTVIFISGQRYAAEIAFTQAVQTDRAKGDLDKIITLLDRAATINRFDDIYYRNLAQALLLKVGQEINNVKDPSQMKPEDRQRIQALTGASVNAAARATDLSPGNPLNWLIRGAVYRELIPVIGNAGDFAVQALQKAVALEPSNPSDLTELGQAYLSIAEFNRQLTAAKDEKVQKDAKDKMDLNLGLAEQQFNAALALKDDYSPAHYQIAVIKERQGKLDDAISKMEQVAKYNQQDVGVAFQLGLLYLRRGTKDDLSRAQAAFEYAVQLLPSYSNARWFLASIYEQQGKIDKAIEQIQKVAELNPDNDLVKSRLERLKNGTTSSAIPPTVEAGDQSATTVPDGQPTQKPPATTTKKK